MHYDLVVLGGGSAGYAAAALAARGGLRTVVVEGGSEVGGLCILRGCMPSKTLLASAERASAVRHSGILGVRSTYQGLDMPAIQRRKAALVEDFASYRRGQLTAGKFDFLRGFARFVESHAVRVVPLDGSAEVEVRGAYFLIATGSRPFTPRISGLEEVSPMDSDRFLSAEYLPRSVVILGGGAIALEAASFYSAAAVPVTLLQRSSRLLKEADPDVSEVIAASLQARGVTVRTGVSLCSFERVFGDEKRVSFAVDGCHGALEHVDAAEVLCALGRVPCIGGLELEAAGIAVERGGVHVAETQQTSMPHVFAAGDVCGLSQVVHMAIAEAEVAARNILRLAGKSAGGLESTDRRVKLLAVFSEPGVAMAGLSEADAQRAGREFLSAKYPFADHGKAMVAGCTEGFVKLIVDAGTREIIGASVVGSHAAELIHEIAVAMHFKATAADLARVPHYHPTLSEIWTYPAEELS